MGPLSQHTNRCSTKSSAALCRHLSRNINIFFFLSRGENIIHTQMSEMSVGDAHMERCGAAWDAAERGTSPKGRGVQNTNLRTQYSILRTFINISQQLFIFMNVRMSDVCIAGNSCKNRIYKYIYI